jgi:hypothetical protein
MMVGMTVFQFVGAHAANPDISAGSFVYLGLLRFPYARLKTRDRHSLAFFKSLI